MWRRFSYFLFAIFFCFAIAPNLLAQDWIKSGTGLGVERIRIAVPEFKAANQDPRNSELLRTFNDTLWNDLTNAGIFEMVSKSFYPLGQIGAPSDVKFDTWGQTPVNAAMLVFGNLGASGNNVVVQGWLVGRLARRLPEPALVLAGTIALAAGFAWIPYAGALGTLLAALGLVIAGQGLASPSLSSLISKTSAAHAHGEALGVAQSLSAGARFVGPSAGGFVLDRLSVRAVFLAAAVSAGMALAVTACAAPPDADGSSADVVRLRRSG